MGDGIFVGIALNATCVIRDGSLVCSTRDLARCMIRRCASQYKAIQHAYEILNDEQKRKDYDQYGEKGPDGGRDGPMDMNDLFSMLHGGGGRGGGRGQRQRRKGEDVQFPLKVEMHELYKGAVKKLKLTKSIICKTCKGKGGRDGSAVAKCASCRGHGVKLVVRQIGPVRTALHCTHGPCCTDSSVSLLCVCRLFAGGLDAGYDSTDADSVQRVRRSRRDDR
jgi:hypothetical protein